MNIFKLVIGSLVSLTFLLSVQAGDTEHVGLVWKDRLGNTFVISENGQIYSLFASEDYEGFFVKMSENGQFAKLDRPTEAVIFRDIHISGTMRYDETTKGGNQRVEIITSESGNTAIVSANLAIEGIDFRQIVDTKIDFIADAIYLPEDEMPFTAHDIIQQDEHSQGFYLTNFRLASPLKE